ncbi:MAG TPA: response regulator [Spirochaetia bacterium]|nr:response regulator [Spirochaetia bacterium]
MDAKVLDILVVDDQPGVRQLINVLGREEGHRMHMATNGQEAVEAAGAIQPDLVFMDVRMPVMDGLEALPLIREINPKAVVIMMTAYTGDATSRVVLENRADAVMTKPFDLENVRAMIRKVAFTRPGWELASGCAG